MRYLTAVEAAKRIGVTERTVRLWIEQGKLPADHTPSNRLAIPESEVERIAKEKGRIDMSAADFATLAVKVLELEQKNAELQEKIAALEKKCSQKPREGLVDSSVDHFSDAREKTVHRASNPKQNDLPPGYIFATNFARAYGVHPITFRDHILIGLGRGEKEKVKAEERPKPSRPHETERYLTPEQQAAALDFWKRHGVPYKEEKPVVEEPLWYLPDK